MRSLKVMGEKFAGLPPLLARGAMGLRFMAAGGGKLYYMGKLVGVLEQQHHLPGLRIWATALSLLELFCGAALVIGYRTRLMTLPLIGALCLYAGIDMAQTHRFLRRDAAFDLSVYVILLLWLFVAGPGKLSVDARLSEDEVKPAIIP